MSGRIRAPWTPEQVEALNAFQQRGPMHPFTCGHEHPAHPNAVLKATTDGWRCYVTGCDYEQDWAHAVMADPAAWRQPPFGERHGPTPQEVAAALHRSAEDTVTRVIALHEQWVKAGPPPLGVPLARWWDARLAEQHAAIIGTTEHPQEQP